MWLLNLGKPTNVPPMNEAMAIDLGANLLGEGILFTIAAALLIFEYSRQSASNEKKEREQKQQIEDLKYVISELSMHQEQHKAQIRELFRYVYDIDSRVVKVPWSPKANPYKDENTPLPTINSKKVVNDQSVINEALYYIQNTLYKPSSAECAPRKMYRA